MPHHDQLSVTHEADLRLFHSEITQRINHHVASNAIDYVQLRNI